jgi:hypothetical protein
MDKSLVDVNIMNVDLNCIMIASYKEYSVMDLKMSLW